ncbi:MAG: hypothetical protein V3W34_18640 [Phycisphaerae bacterium]
MRKGFISGVCIGIAALCIVEVASGQGSILLCNIRVGSPVQYTVDGKQKQLEVEVRDIAPGAEGALGQRCVVYRVARYAVGRDPRLKTREATVWQWWQRYYSRARPIPYFTAALVKDPANASFYVVVGDSMSYYLRLEVYRLDVDADRKLQEPRFNGFAVEPEPNDKPLASYRVRFDPSEGGAKTIEAQIEDGEIVLTAIRHGSRPPPYEIRYDLKSNRWIERSLSEQEILDRQRIQSRKRESIAQLFSESRTDCERLELLRETAWSKEKAELERRVLSDLETNDAIRALCAQELVFRGNRADRETVVRLILDADDSALAEQVFPGLCSRASAGREAARVIPPPDPRVIAIGMDLFRREHDRHPGNAQGGYFIARDLAHCLGVRFAPSEDDERYKGQHGLNDAFFVETVRNAERWISENEARIRRASSSHAGGPGSTP